MREAARAGRYLYALALISERLSVATSDQIGAVAGTNATQVRRDLSHWLGKSGQRGTGYKINKLRDQLAPSKRERICVLGNGSVAGFGKLEFLKTVGFTIVGNLDEADVAVIDHEDSEKGLELARLAVDMGVELIISFGDYEIPLRQSYVRVVYASPSLAVAAAITERREHPVESARTASSTR